MSSLKLKHSGGNSVIIAAPSSNPASDRTLTVPSNADGTILTTTNPKAGNIIQVKQTLNKFYGNQTNLVLLKVDALKLQKLVWEQSSSGDMFPHLYSDFDIDCVIKEYYLDLKEDGKHDIPSEI